MRRPTRRPLGTPPAPLTIHRRTGRWALGFWRRGAEGEHKSQWDERLRLFALGAHSPSDQRGPWVYVTSRRAARPQWLATTYRQRPRVEQAIEELLNGHDLDHLVTYRLLPNRKAIGFRLLARNLALGHQLAEAGGRPPALRKPAAFRAAHVHGLGLFAPDPADPRLLRLTPTALGPTAPAAPPLPPAVHLPWTDRRVYLAA